MSLQHPIRKCKETFLCLQGNQVLHLLISRDISQCLDDSGVCAQSTLQSYIPRQDTTTICKNISEVYLVKNLVSVFTLL